MIALVKPIPIELDKPRALLYDFNALAEFEDATGWSIGEALIGHGDSAKMLRALLWCGLLHETPNLTIEEVGSWLDLKSFGDIRSKIDKAVAAALPRTEDLPDPPPQGQPETPGRKRRLSRRTPTQPETPTG
jgi:hypothetical protein